MSRRSAGALMTVVLALSAALAISLPTASGSRHDVVTLRALFPTTAQAGYQILVANFNRVYPDIHIDAQFLPSDTLGQLLVTQVQAGNAPDIVHLQAGNLNAASVWGLGSQGKLLDLSGRPWVKRIYPAARADVTWKGKVYAWPLAMGPFGVIYNADLFKQLGLKVPATFNEALAMCTKINAAGKIPFVQAWGASTTGSIVGRQRYSQYVYTVDPKWDQKRAAHQVTFLSSPLWRKALQSVIDMKNANCFQQGATGTSRAQQYAMFAQGQAVMSIVSAGEVTNVKTINPNIKIGWMNLPGESAKTSTLVGPFSLTIGGMASTTHPKEVKTFIDFMAREQQSTLFAKVASSIAPLDAKKKILPPEMKGLLPYFASGKVTDAHDFQWPNARVYSEGYQLGVVGLVTGQLTIDDVLKKMDDLWDNG
jgi:raffinose/stachyose/melibiose transport system substrate-binding protein